MRLLHRDAPSDERVEQKYEWEVHGTAHLSNSIKSHNHRRGIKILQKSYQI
jgi:hypothetical protein